MLPKNHEFQGELHEMQQSPVLSFSPSLSSFSSSKLAEIASNFNENPAAAAQTATSSTENFASESESLSCPVNEASHVEPPPNTAEASNDVDDGGNDDFEFAFVCRDSNDSPISADEIFFNGQIRPIFPVFNRNVLSIESALEKPENERRSVRLPLGKLMFEDRDLPSSSSSEADELEGIPDGTYCVWRPRPVGTSASASANYRKKSNSTGSSKRWRLRNFLHRSNSDGKETFVFLATPPEKKSEKTGPSKERKDSRDDKAAGDGKKKDVSGAEMRFIRNRASKEDDRRKSFLPYRQDLVGLFANVGLSRGLHPF